MPAPAARSLAAIVILLLAGCSKSPDLSSQVHKSFDQVRESVRKEAGNPARADSLMAVVDSVEQRSLVLVRAVREENAMLFGLFADRSVDEATLLARYREAEQRRSQLRGEVLESRKRLKSTATPEEWSAMARAETQAMNELTALSRGK